MQRLLLSSFLVLAAAGAARADVITFFDFNDSDLASDRGQMTTITTNFSATTFIAGSTVNADPDGGGPEPASPAGQALNLANSANNGRHIQFGVSTVGLGGLQLSFATQRSAAGFNNNELLFSTDGGTSFTSVGFYNPPTSFALQSFDLSAFTAVNGQAQVIFRLVFNGATSTGTNRIDNLLVSGSPQTSPVPEPAAMMLFAAGLLGAAGAARRRVRAGG
jgi:hypothetical protein